MSFPHKIEELAELHLFGPQSNVELFIKTPVVLHELPALIRVGVYISFDFFALDKLFGH